ncbi:hypothetical protein ACFP3Q_05645 [Nocardioides sp. GCM10027113]|uniref:hypothetical protein n=1 Tax=unclassified Nocardioides TaxID=2615069 RepID=UPI00360ADF5E
MTMWQAHDRLGAGAGGAEPAALVADRLQRTVLDQVMRVSYSLAGAVGAGSDSRTTVRIADAIEQLDGVARELLDVIVDLRTEGER